jgi:hypothetical protein
MAEKPLTFVISDESINTYGMRVMTEGIDTSDFERNPVMYWDHNWWQGAKPIGHWANIRKEESKLLADAVFDDDEESQLIKAKILKGSIRACSAGLDIVETSTEAAFILQGQSRPTITKSKIFEASITGLPANKSALRLRKGDEIIALNSNSGLAQILTPIPDKAKFEQDSSLSSHQLELLQRQSQELALELGRMKGVVTKQNENHYRKLISHDLGAVVEIFKQQVVPKVPPIIEQLKLQETDNKEDWNFEQWSKKDPEGLLKLKLQNPEKYQQLAKNYKQ